MQYSISYSNPLTHYLEIEVLIKNVDGHHVDLKLPVWRPGRYEAAHYAKNVQQLHAFSLQNSPLQVIKTAPSQWRIISGEQPEIRVKYRYYAYQMDAGNSFLDEGLLYINFINCLVYTDERINMPCEVRLNLPDTYEIACGLRRSGYVLQAKDYYELVDCPLMASEHQEYYKYTIGSTEFHLWIHGEHPLDTKQVIGEFEKFSRTQINAMGEFPEKDYHFLLFLLPYKFYHGVEHRNSTVVCIGPAGELKNDDLYNEFLGVSSHELFHAWNIIKIRPHEMMPYDFGKPVIFPTGFVAEGFTTYYGDLFLKRSGVFSLKQYCHELDKLFGRHFMNFGRLNNSVTDSSVNLWIDGYQTSAPHGKSSIYVEGAVIALLLDLQIRSMTNHERSLDDVMKILWVDFGKTGKGYSYQDIVNSCEKVSGGPISEFFNDYVKGTRDTKSLLQELLSRFGLNLSFEDNSNRLERTLGIRLVQKEEGYEVIMIEPDAVGEHYFSNNDRISTINDQPAPEWLENNTTTRDLNIIVLRNHEKKQITLTIDDRHSYLKIPNVSKVSSPSMEQHNAFYLWLGDE